MRYLPHTEEDVSSMLKTISMNQLEDLFAVIPDDCKFKKPPILPTALTEWELGDLMADLSRNMATRPQYKVFTGAGSYEHYIPASIRYLLARSEFSTAYTPYQPEISQGTLQGIFEYQTLVSRLLGMEVSNASMYDGASALAEAMLMSIRITGKKRIVVSKLVHPYYREVIKTYFKPTNYEIIELPYTKEGKTDFSGVTKLQNPAAIAVQSPNFFGCIEDLKPIAELTHNQEALFVVSFTEPLAYGLLRNPGSLGADISCGEGGSLGIPQSFGGPGLGIFTCNMKHVRGMPGRLVGKTKDVDGKRGFVLTLATREQHIRREKATSNICTNSSLNALAAAMYLASLGKSGFHGLARLNHDKSEYLKKGLLKEGVTIPFNSPTFNEFVVEFPKGFETTYKRLLEKKIIAGLPLVRLYPELPDHYLLCVTETITQNDMDTFINEVKK